MWQYVAALDKAAADWAVLHRTPAATAFMRLMTFIGSPAMMTVIGLITVGYLYRARGRRPAFTMAGALLGSWLLNELLKALFHRPRPPGPWLTSASGYSFPSGHAMVSMSFFLVLAVILTSDTRSHAQRWIAIGSGVLISLVIGASRVYLGVHYASDVIGGFIIGALWGLLSLMLASRNQLERPPIKEVKRS